VELPGIEPGPKIALNWENSGIYDAKVRESACGYAKGVDGINRSTTSMALLSQELREFEPDVSHLLTTAC
jgi:hypothetical protein